MTVPRRLIAEAIDVVAYLAGRGATRHLAALVAVAGLDQAGDYRTVSLDPDPSQPNEGETTC